ncbi:unnamed protein product [Rotaria magnacalcarata]|uniref:Ion transport domain-containing protein n=1 Tax=Rotaria magnacalcarata TaxID=392030 RepID=A0A8S3IBD7_9BILA|nr:unnamed protein product [Rotaria magnacalcarata]CAF5195137.1 unnamed protein product [Rotaria magnacalcarata]
MVESSQLMKKALKAVQKDLVTIIACVAMALAHILFFAIMAMFLFPRSETQKDSQGSTYFSSLHDSVFQLLVLYSTANNPDVMMPAYSDNRLNVLFFLVFVIIGIYWIQNLITAVVYRAFRGYFLNSIINSQLRRRVAVKASFEALKKQIFNQASNEIRHSISFFFVLNIIEFFLLIIVIECLYQLFKSLSIPHPWVNGIPIESIK